MAAFMDLLDWARQTLNEWRSRMHERRASTSHPHHDLADDARAGDVHHKLNMEFLSVLPPL
jgi:hypothetical protein